MRHRAHVVHHSPGRIRLKIPSAKGNRHFFDEVSKSVSKVNGVRRVDVNPVTGSVLIEHHEKNPALFEQRMKVFSETSTLLSLALPEFAEAEEVSSIIESEAELLAKHSRVADSILNACKSINLQLKQVTNNVIDLNLLFPVVFAAYGLFYADRKKNGVAWIMLVLLAVHIFASLHRNEVVVSPNQKTV